MLVMERPYIGRLTAPNPSLMTGKGTNTYIFGGDDLAIIDPGPDDDAHVAAIVDGIAEMGGTPAVILITHSHLDHLPGAFSLQRRIGVPIAAYAPILGVDIGLRHEQRLTIGGHPLRVLHTPGHAPDHLCFLLERDGTLFSGDLIAGSGTIVIGRDGDLDDYLRSLESLLALDLGLILPGHGPAITDPRERIEGYIAHRHEREREILAALAAELVTRDELVEEIYAAVDSRLHPIAAQSVESHLRKLIREGRVARYEEDGEERYRLTGDGE